MQIQATRSLTTHEIEVLKKLGQSGDIKSTADNMFLSEAAVIKSLSNIRRKLNMTTIQTVYTMAKRGVI